MPPGSFLKIDGVGTCSSFILASVSSIKAANLRKSFSFAENSSNCALNKTTSYRQFVLEIKRSKCQNQFLTVSKSRLYALPVASDEVPKMADVFLVEATRPLVVCENGLADRARHCGTFSDNLLEIFRVLIFNGGRKHKGST